MIDQSAYKERLRQNFRESRELQRLQDPRVQGIIRYHQRACEQRGIPHEFDRAWSLLNKQGI